MKKYIETIKKKKKKKKKLNLGSNVNIRDKYVFVFHHVTSYILLLAGYAFGVSCRRLMAVQRDVVVK